MAWYREEEWEELLEAVADPGGLADTYEEWEETAEVALDRLREAGLDVRPVDVGVAELVSWCEERGRDVDSRARTHFVTAKLRRRSGES